MATGWQAEASYAGAEDHGGARERKRDALLLAAVRMFNAKGYHATSLDEVAAAVGVTKPVVYYYVGNKENVLVECVRRGLSGLQQAIDITDLRQSTALERLRAYLERYATYSMSDFGRSTTLTEADLLSDGSAEELRRLKRQVDQTLRNLVRDGIDDGSIAATDVRLTAFTLFGALNWTARWYLAGGPEAPQEIAEKMVSLLLDGIAPR